jgi:hypothetical protein
MNLNHLPPMREAVDDEINFLLEILEVLRDPLTILGYEGCAPAEIA